MFAYLGNKKPGVAGVNQGGKASISFTEDALNSALYIFNFRFLDSFSTHFLYFIVSQVNNFQATTVKFTQGLRNLHAFSS